MIQLAPKIRVSNLLRKSYFSRQIMYVSHYRTLTTLERCVCDHTRKACMCQKFTVGNESPHHSWLPCEFASARQTALTERHLTFSKHCPSFHFEMAKNLMHFEVYVVTPIPGPVVAALTSAVHHSEEDIMPVTLSAKAFASIRLQRNTAQTNNLANTTQPTMFCIGNHDNVKIKSALPHR